MTNVTPTKEEIKRVIEEATTKQPTKREITDAICGAYYLMKPHNTMVVLRDITLGSHIMQDMENNGIEVNTETFIKEFKEKYYNNFNSLAQLHLIMGNFQKCYERLEETEKEKKMVIDLVKRADTKEKLDKIKKLPIFNE